MSILEVALALLIIKLVRAILRLFRAARHPDTQMSSQELTEALRDVISHARDEASLIATKSFGEQMAERTSDPTYLIPREVVAATTPKVDEARTRDSEALLKSVSKIIESKDDGERVVMRVTRLAKSEVARAAQEATQEAMKHEPLVIGWRRQMESDACQLCRWWSREGKVWPVSHRMPTHKGCMCSQEVVVKETTKGTNDDEQ